MVFKSDLIFVLFDVFVFVVVVVVVVVLFCFVLFLVFETGFLCVALAVL